MLEIFLGKPKKSFTLVELLVVVAIIALLSGIGATYLVGYQKRSKDGRIIATMDLFRKTADIVYQNEVDYDCVCDGTATNPKPAGCTAATCNGDIIKISNDINGLNATSQTDLRIYRYPATSGATAYCAEVQLNFGWYCVDSTLESRQYDSDPDCLTGDYTCKTD